MAGFSNALKVAKPYYNYRLLQCRYFTMNACIWSSSFPIMNRSAYITGQKVSRIPQQYFSRCMGLNGKMLFSRKVPRIYNPRPLFSTNSYFSSISNQNDETKKLRLSIPQQFVASCPPSLQPFLRLSRVQNPIGTWLLFWPCTWGLALGTGGLPDLYLLTLFGAGAFIMRGAGCTVNDMWDKHIDAKVQRTANRPLASGELRTRHAAAWLFFQLSLAFSILLQLNPPCFIIGVGSLALVCIYPLAKRITNWPQAVLGLTFNTGVIMGITAAQNSQLGYLTFPWLDSGCLSLYLAGISWTLIYDTIYAHQDLSDDTTLGLGSTARRFGENSKVWLSGFSCLTISSLTAAGIFADLSWPYYAGIAAAASHLVWQIKTLDIHNAQNCSDRFNSNRHIGWIIFMSIVGSYIMENRKRIPQNPTLVKEKSTSSTMIDINSNIDTTSILNADKHTCSNHIVKNYASLTNS